MEAAFEEKNKLMTQKLKEMHAKVEELTLHRNTAEEQKVTLYNDAKAEAAKAHALAMEQEIKSLRSDMEREMEMKIKESEDIHEAKFREMAEIHSKMQKEMESKAEEAERRRVVAGRFHVSLQVGRLQRAEEKKVGKRKSLREQILESKEKKKCLLKRKNKIMMNLYPKRGIKKEREILARKVEAEKKSLDAIKEEKERHLMESEERQTKRNLQESSINLEKR